ncbi:hypothetical protein JOD02_001258 [Caldicoprobacter guelmensis]|uniref:hypothetical protein n=1 Tax=Caldicoprobacter guelmensis TaxID=1170224 RepID=UPI00195E8450|nr:hypothetical protein [Caldicoprobacter guelmensis]MBM7582401.1 hypothetical protein [Caldicoprobacter guelmensis]
MAKGYYHRSFVILQPKDPKFNIKGEKPATGYCKIEVRNDKCKMYFHVQDLKPRDSEQGGYDIFLISAQEGILPQKIASIYVDQRGRGECAVEIDVDRVGGSGYSLEQFHGLAVVCNDGGGISYPLVGYANKRVELDWEGRIKKELGRLYNKLIKPTVESKKGSSPAKLVEEKKNEGAKKEISFLLDDKQDNKQDNKQKTLQDIIVALGPLLQSRRQENEMGNDKVKAGQDMDGVKGVANDSEGLEGSAMLIEEKEKVEIQDVEDNKMSEELQGMTSMQTSGIEGSQKNMPYENDAEKEAVRDIKEQACEDNVESHGSNLLEGQTYWDKAKDYYTWLFETYRRVYPFFAEVGEIEWVEVPCENDYGHYGYIAPQHISNNYYCDHYIVGLVRENGQVRYVAYGVPGPYGPVPFMFMQGFSRWVPSRYGFGMGYWLLYIDACTGEIAYPC